MLDFHTKEMKSKVLSRFTEWIYKSTTDLHIFYLVRKIKVGTKLYKKGNDLSKIKIV